MLGAKCVCAGAGTPDLDVICSPSLLTRCLLCAHSFLPAPRSSGPTFAAAASATPSEAPAAVAAVAAVAASAAAAAVDVKPAFDVDALFLSLDQF